MECIDEVMGVTRAQLVWLGLRFKNIWDGMWRGTALASKKGVRVVHVEFLKEMKQECVELLKVVLHLEAMAR